MTEIKIFNDVEVRLIAHTGSDDSVVQAARVSVAGENERPVWGHPDWEKVKRKDEGLINYLVREKHGSPFEHNSMTFFVKCPIFVAREYMRHRVGFSYNELSGRYAELEPEFYIPAENRPLTNVGTSSKPEMAEGDEYQKQLMYFSTIAAYQHAWNAYKDMLEMKVANEVARQVLPLGIMTQFYVTLNLRSGLNFLSLRTHEETAEHVSRPQHEIELVARKMEQVMNTQFPITMAAYNKVGRVAP